MDVLNEILLESGLLLLALFSLLGAALSLLLMVSPATVQRLSDRFNRYVDVDHRLAFLDRDIPTNRFIYRHHRIAGGVFIAGGLILIGTLFVGFDFDRMERLWVTRRLYFTLDEIIVSVLILLGRVAGVAGLLLGIVLVVDPGRLQMLESRMASGVSFQPLVDRINAFHDDVDAVLLRHPVIFGACGLLASILLLLVSFSALRH